MAPLQNEARFIDQGHLSGELLYHDGPPQLEIFSRGEATASTHQSGRVEVVVPWLPTGQDATVEQAIQRTLLDDLLERQRIDDYVLWYYTPMALGFSDHLEPRITVYDCMDELSAFQGAPPGIVGREAQLLRRADLVFAGGQSLCEAKQRHHSQVHAFPSSVDVAHFGRARLAQADPADQAGIPGPRLGVYGVLDERLDTELIAGVAALRPAWQIVMIGPVAKIDPARLPQYPNVHYLGSKPYAELPDYLAGWDVALLPFARNAATRFISPTKTPEYLAAGKPVVSTSIHDVVRPYGEQGLVHLADTPESFVRAVEAALREDTADRLRQVDAYLADVSWDRTWLGMARLIQEAVEVKRTRADARDRHHGTGHRAPGTQSMVRAVRLG